MSSSGGLNVLSEIEIRQIKEAITNIDRTLSRIADKLPALAAAAGEVKDELKDAGAALEDVADATDAFVDVQVSGFQKVRVLYRDLVAAAEESESKVVQVLTRVAKGTAKVVGQGTQMAKDSMRRSGVGVAYESYGIAGVLMYGLQGMAAADVQASQISQRFQKLGAVSRTELESVKNIMASAKASGIDAGASLGALSESGMTASESLVNVVSVVDGQMRSLSDYTARLDEIFELPEGSVAKLSAAISTNLGNTLPEAANLVATLGAEARRAGMDVGVMASAIESSVGSMRLGMQSAEGLIKTYSAAGIAAQSLFGSGARGRQIGADFGNEMIKDQQGKEILEQKRGLAMVNTYLKKEGLPGGVQEKLEAIKADPIALIEFSKNPALMVPELKDDKEDFSTLRAEIAVQMTNKAGLTGFGQRKRFMTNLLGNENLASMLAGEMGDRLLGRGNGYAVPQELRDEMESANKQSQEKKDPFERISEIINAMVSTLLKSIIQLLSAILALFASVAIKILTFGALDGRDIGLAEPRDIITALITQQKLNFEQLKEQAGGLGTVGEQLINVVGFNAFQSGKEGAAARTAAAEELKKTKTKNKKNKLNIGTRTLETAITTTGADGVVSTTTSTSTQNFVMVPVDVAQIRDALSNE